MEKKLAITKCKLKRGDRVIVIAGTDKGKEGKVLTVNKKTNRLVIENINMITKHQKPTRTNQKGGLVKKEAPIHASNVMFVHKGKPTRIGYKLEETEKNGKKVTNKYRVAKSTGERID